MAGPVLSAAELVLRDLLDALLQEGLCRCAPAGGPTPDGTRTHRIPAGDGAVEFRGRPGGALQPVRYAGGPVVHRVDGAPPRSLAPAELLALVVPDAPRGPEVAADLRAAVAHARVVLAAGAGPPRPGGLLAGERLAATRNRPFHPTARAAAGWTADELRRYGTARRDPLGLDWVAVRADRLRTGSGPGGDRPAEALLDPPERARLAAALDAAGLDPAAVAAVPVHPWHAARVLPGAFAAELDRGEIVPLARDLGRFAPTAALRTLATAPERDVHVKLPLAVATLGATRLLPPRYLDNGERAQRLLTALCGRDPVLRGTVALCDERAWCGWRDPGGDDAFDDRPGLLAAQLRRYPPGLLDDPDRVVLPMAALAAHAWDRLGPALGADGPAAALALFGALAERFCAAAVAFLAAGALPELHGQNVVVALRPAALAGGDPAAAVGTLVLRDHDTVRLHRPWLAAAGLPDPGYRIRPGAPQSLVLDEPAALVGYLQTLGVQVNLYGIADALCRHHGVAEERAWRAVAAALRAALDRVDPPAPVADALRRALCAAPGWPSRLVLGPLLRAGRSSGVSMPAGVGTVPNPLRPDPHRPGPLAATRPAAAGVPD